VSKAELRPPEQRLRLHLVRHTRERGQAIILILVVIAVGAGIAWWLFTARQQSEEEARAFARDAARRMAFDLDRKFLDRVIAPDQVAKYPPSFRDRIIEKLRGFGRPSGDIELDGKVHFTSHFFEPTARFRARLTYPQSPVDLYLAISRPKGWWQIDDMNVSWDQPPPPETPPPSPSPTVSASPQSRRASK
jgi:hypothetical protein